MVYLQTSICLDQNQQKLIFEHGRNYNNKEPKSGIILKPDCIKFRGQKNKILIYLIQFNFGHT